VNEEEALSKAKRGQEAGFAWLFERYRGPVYHFVRRHRDLDAPSAEDVLQEVFVRAFRSLGDLRNDERFAGWLFRIARREALRSLSRRRGAPLSDEALEQACVDEEQRLERLEYERLLSRIRELAPTIEPRAVRETALRYYLGEPPCTTLALAEELGVPHATVRKRLFLFRNKLKERVLQEEGLSP
jgi:RNA polymerase sigma-70 factor (ECF subfamily)